MLYIIHLISCWGFKILDNTIILNILLMAPKKRNVLCDCGDYNTVWVSVIREDSRPKKWFEPFVIQLSVRLNMMLLFIT